ncbi:MAG: hypothetical protein JWM28_4533 [Chitinophagaceae bacterium]|nr:hypothetical protein [Chitinophagaceae bacterium]
MKTGYKNENNFKRQPGLYFLTLSALQGGTQWPQQYRPPGLRPELTELDQFSL